MQCKSCTLGQNALITHYGGLSKPRSKHEFHSLHIIIAQKCWIWSESEAYIITTEVYFICQLFWKITKTLILRISKYLHASLTILDLLNIFSTKTIPEGYYTIFHNTFIVDLMDISVMFKVLIVLKGQAIELKMLTW